jgi:transcription initiation factor IIF auxiliary subunit
MNKKAMLQISCLTLFLVAAQRVPGQGDIQTRNSAHYAGNGRYDWTVCVNADQSTLNSIRYVEYTLHPTFPDPVRYGAGPNFSLSSNGWGEFNIRVKIAFRDGRERRTQHWLTLSRESKDCALAVNRRAVRRR